MEPDLISAINRLAAAHERLADNMGRIAAALAFDENTKQDLTFAEGLVEKVGQIATALERIEERLPEAKN